MGCSSSRTTPVWVLSTERSPSGTGCSSVGPPVPHRVTSPVSKPAPAWYPLSTGPQVLPGACSSVGSLWGHSLLGVYPPAPVWDPPQAAGGYLLHRGPPWAAGGQHASPWSSSRAAGAPLLWCLKHLLPPLHRPWCLQSCFSHVCSLL